MTMDYEYIIRLILATLMGAAIGLEREYRAKEAGSRTHSLVALGSALFMILSEYGFQQSLHDLGSIASFDPSRIAAQVVTGIGFIGAGTIIFQKHVVRGLTTAAGLWVTAAIGLTAGGGLYVLATASTVLVLVCLELMNILHRNFGYRNINVTVSSPRREKIEELLHHLREVNVDIDSYELRHNDTSAGTYFTATMELKVRRRQYEDRVIDFMAELDGVSVDEIE